MTKKCNKGKNHKVVEGLTAFGSLLLRLSKIVIGGVDWPGIGIR